MKNLNEMSVQEMDAKEMREENGGIWQLIVVAAVTVILTDWDNFENGLSGRPYEK